MLSPATEKTLCRINPEADHKIKVGKGKAAQVGQVSNPGVVASHLIYNLKHSVTENKHPCRHGDNAEKEHGGIGEYNSIGQEHCKEGTGGTQKEYAIITGVHIDKVREDAGKSSAYKVEQEEFLAADGLFHSHAEEVETKHVEEKVTQAPVDKHVGYKLPVHVMMGHVDRVHGQVRCNPAVHGGKQEYCHIDYDYVEAPVLVNISESG